MRTALQWRLCGHAWMWQHWLPRWWLLGQVESISSAHFVSCTNGSRETPTTVATWPITWLSAFCSLVEEAVPSEPPTGVWQHYCAVFIHASPSIPWTIAVTCRRFDICGF